VNEDSDSDDENTEEPQMEMMKTRVRRRIREEDLKIRKEDTREEIKEKFNCLKEEMNEMKGSIFPKNSPINLSFHLLQIMLLGWSLRLIVSEMTKKRGKRR
jgi:hypothetical protein